MSLPEGITRRFIPSLGDVVTISSPHHLSLFNTHPDIGRPDQGALPSLVSTLLSATQFRTPHYNNGEYSVPFTTMGYNDYSERRKRVERNLENGFSEKQMEQIKELVWSGKEENKIAIELVRIVGPGVIGLKHGIEVPDSIVGAIGEMDLEGLLNPIRYVKARAARRKVEQWVSGLEQFKEEKHIIDIVHDLVNVYFGFAKGLVRLRKLGHGVDVKEYFCENAILPISARTPLKDTTVGGLFEKELRKDRTVIVMKNGEAAKVSGEDEFVFGMGGGRRVCPFRGLFFETCEKVVEKRDWEEAGN